MSEGSLGKSSKKFKTVFLKKKNTMLAFILALAILTFLVEKSAERKSEKSKYRYFENLSFVFSFLKNGLNHVRKKSYKKVRKFRIPAWAEVQKSSRCERKT